MGDLDLGIAWKLLIALVLGLVVGFERGWQSREVQEGLRAAGIRTFGFVGLLGGVSALLAAEFGGLVLAVALLGLSLVVAASYWLTATRSQDFGTTTELSLLLVFGLGAMAVRGFEVEALAAAVVMTVALRFKREVHHSLEKLAPRELDATLQLLMIAVVAIPLLPNREMGPWGALNPRSLGLFVLLIASISYVGYFAVRLLGPRIGLFVTALLGGLTSSTAVTISFARMVRSREGSPKLLGAGIALAAGTMAPRLLLEVAIVDRSVVPHLWLPTAILALVPLLAALMVARTGRAPEPATDLQLRNPLELRAACAYGVALTLLFLLVRGAKVWLGERGIYAVAALSGIVDVDAVAISLAAVAGSEIPAGIAANGILVAALVNTAAKAVLAMVIGGRALVRPCATILVTALVLSAASMVLLGGRS